MSVVLQSWKAARVASVKCFVIARHSIVARLRVLWAWTRGRLGLVAGEAVFAGSIPFATYSCFPFSRAPQVCIHRIAQRQTQVATGDDKGCGKLKCSLLCVSHLPHNLMLRHFQVDTRFSDRHLLFASSTVFTL